MHQEIDGAVQRSFNIKKINYSSLAKNRKKWDAEAKRIIIKLSESDLAAPKVQPKLYCYEEVRELL